MWPVDYGRVFLTISSEYGNLASFLLECVPHCVSKCFTNLVVDTFVHIWIFCSFTCHFFI
jgi:hypothetical protein